MQRLLLLLALMLSVLAPLHAQLVDGPDFVDYYRKGEAALARNEAEAALRFFKRSLKARPGFTAALRGQGISYELLRDYPKAAESYEQILQSDSTFARTLYYEAGTALYKAGKPEKAIQYFRQFRELQQDSLMAPGTEQEFQVEQRYMRKLPSSIRACEVSLDSAKFINITEVVNVGPNVNTKADDYFPFVNNEQNRMLFTRKTDKGDEDLYESRLVKGIWARGSAVRELNSKQDEGMSTMVRDGRLLFYTVCGREGVLGACDIWEAKFDENQEVTTVSPLKGFANSESWESQASISCDGSTLYFSSKRDGGMGGTDLWYSQRQADGSWGDPVNLGPSINTDLDEEAPFITNDGQTLYFSSNGHPGMGDQDIFMSWLDKDGAWTTPINLGPPVNSAFRELGFFLTADDRTGYFASDRTEDSYGGLDIYRFRLDSQLHSQPITFVEGLVLDSSLDMTLPATIRFADRQDLTVGKDGRFFLCVPADDTLDVKIDKKYFHPYANKFIIPRWDNKQFYTIELRLRSTFEIPEPDSSVTADTTVVKKTVKRPKFVEYAHTIYFDFDEKEIDYQERKKFLEFLRGLGDKAEEVRIIGYSDDIGTDGYNMRLSADRAKAISLLLVREGPDVKSMHLEGKGEVKNGQPREQNRRVEVKVKVRVQ